VDWRPSTAPFAAVSAATVLTDCFLDRMKARNLRPLTDERYYGEPSLLARLLYSFQRGTNCKLRNKR